MILTFFKGQFLLRFKNMPESTDKIGTFVGKRFLIFDQVTEDERKRVFRPFKQNFALGHRIT